MAIMHSCCCWRSLRKGSYASAVYTFGYFTLIVMIMANFVHEERHYWSGNTTIPHSHSFLEPGTISPTTMAFNLVALICGCLGALTCFLLVYAIYTDQRIFLVPWIFTIATTTTVDLAHSLYMFALETMSFNPMTAILFTIDFFLLCLNVYCLLCVVSQYQEYIAGRGTAEFDIRVPPVRYMAQSTDVTVSSRRAATYQDTGSPTQAHCPFPAADESTFCPLPPQLPAGMGATALGQRRLSKKHVQFGCGGGDDRERAADFLRVHWKEEESDNVDKEPVIPECAVVWTNSDAQRQIQLFDTEPLIHTLTGCAPHQTGAN
ncbi:uncharacterized protein LOC111059764 [Nilaparvata lugens]|uniref:uncharacterized protein LOC111059764 n=1 Tax=Nilaparvata lugens TaxID=108931 RepID=UPI00193EAAF6|nr:uncharacterized protein LOC111059764 [Nilaparvata lugens]